MLKMGSPIVDQGGLLSRLRCDDSGILLQPMNKDNLLMEIHRTTEYLVQKKQTLVDFEGKVMRDKNGDPISRLVAQIGEIHYRVLKCICGSPYPENGLSRLRGVRTHPIINQNGEYVMKNGLYWKEEADMTGEMVARPRIHLRDGYDPVSQCFYAIPDRVITELAEIATQKPSTADVCAALDTIDDFLCNCTFATKSAKASAVAFMVTMVCCRKPEREEPAGQDDAGGGDRRAPEFVLAELQRHCRA